MGVIGNLGRISDSTRLKLLDQPELVLNLFYPDYPPSAEPLGDFWKNVIRFFSQQSSQSPAADSSDLGPQEEEPNPPRVFEVLSREAQIDLDKAWHGLHFLFTGREGDADLPGGFLMSGGQTIGDVDVGYGPARVFTLAETHQISDFLAAQDEQQLQAKLDPELFEELGIYPAIWSNYDDGEDWDYLAHYLHAMQKFVRDTAAQQQALLVWYN